MLLGISDALDSVRSEVNSDLPFYSRALESAFRDAAPVFVRQEYADFFWNCATTIPGWAQTIFVQSAAAESIGSKTLYEYFQSVRNFSAAEDGLLRHSRDEARHSRIFLNLVELTFPSFLPAEEATKIRQSLFTPPTKHEKSQINLPTPILLNYLALINQAEIRTLINLHLIAPIFYTLAPAEHRDRVADLLQSLQKDEVAHISYTARIIDDAARSGDEAFVFSMYQRNMEEFGEYSQKGLEEAIKKHGGSDFSHLLLLKSD